MYRRVRLRRKILFPKLKIRHKWLYILIMFLIGLFVLFRYINNRVSPYIQEYACVEAENLVSFVMNKAISNNISGILNLDELFIVSKNANNEINSVDFNPIVVNKVLTTLTEIIHSNLEKLEDGKIDDLELPSDVYVSSFEKRKKGIILEIPSGIVFDNALLANIGPKVPVRISLVGDIISNIDTKVTNYGINNALIEINLNMMVTQKVMLPITMEEVTTQVSIPLALKLIQGNIPNYYLSGLNGSSSILTVPVE